MKIGAGMRRVIAELRLPVERRKLSRAPALKVPIVPRRLVTTYRSLWTANGRQRLRLSAYSRMGPIFRALANLNRRTLARCVRVVVVAGSFGKTTTTRAVTAALGLPASRYVGANAKVALAAAVLGIRPSDHHAVIEVGIGGKGEMADYARLIRPDIAVVTCIGSEHLASFRTLEATRTEKAEIVRALPPSGVAVLNGDDTNVAWMRDSTRARVITYGFDEGNDIRATAVVPEGLSRTRLTLSVDGTAHEICTHLIGRHMVYPILAGIAVARAEGLELGPVLAAVEALPPTANRLQLIQHASGAFLLLDAYKGALETIHAALDTLALLPAERKIVVLGDVEEPPGSQGPIYKELGGHTAQVAVRVLFVGGRRNFERLKAGARPGGLARDALTNVRTGPLEAVKALEPELRAGDLVLIKGRCSEHLERIALILLGKQVGCAARYCSRRHDCESCPLLK